MMRWNSTKTYTEEDILKMQQEAVSRVHDFQQRANSFYDTPDPPAVGELKDPPAVIEAESRVLEEPEVQAQQAAEVPIIMPPPQQPTQPTDPIQGIAEKFGLDSESLLIMGLIFLLHNESADNVLLMALAYLLL